MDSGKTNAVVSRYISNHRPIFPGSRNLNNPSSSLIPLKNPKNGNEGSQCDSGRVHHRPETLANGLATGNCIQSIRKIERHLFVRSDQRRRRRERIGSHFSGKILFIKTLMYEAPQFVECFFGKLPSACAQCSEDELDVAIILRSGSAALRIL